MASTPRETLSGFLEKAKGFAESTGVVDACEKGAHRARSFGNAAKLTMDLGNDRRELQMLYEKIGRLYVEAIESEIAPELSIDPLLEKLSRLRNSIAEKESELERYRDFLGRGRSDIPTAADNLADFEAIVNETESDGKA